MKEFVLIFRMDITSKNAQPSPEQMEIYMKQWEDWMKDMIAKNQLAEGGNHLSREGFVLKPEGAIEKGPYVVNKESVAGYIIINAKNLNDAVKIASNCPILKGNGTSVEVRQVDNA